MGNPEELSNIEEFPLSPRFRHSLSGAENAGSAPLPAQGQSIAKRTLTPSGKVQAQFWHTGEKPSESMPPRHLPKRKTHSKRADQLGLIMGIFALIAVALTFVILHLQKKHISSDNALKSGTSTPVVDFYSGNNAFSKKFHDEKDAKEGVLGSNSLVGADAMEVPLKEQMDSLNEKMEKMRAQKLIDESMLPTPVSTPVAASKIIGVKPVELNKFDNPLEFNGLLPKTIQQTNQVSH